VASLAGALTQVAPLWRIFRANLAAPPAPLAVRDVNQLGPYLDPRALTAAREVIPAGATYAVVVGDTPPTTATQKLAIPLLFQYWLLPRRSTADPRDAQWVIAYDHPSETLGVRVAREVGLAPGVNADLIAR
jgi:hypothetical protein